jgi:RNA polymerase sigma factor (sigma-70 family)
MNDCAEELDFETALARQRTRLVRLCAWFTGSPEAAEDLAQETLIAAWKNREQLHSPDKLKPWISAIARNICLNWSRGDRQERARIAGSIDTPESTIEDQVPDEIDLEVELDRHELATLLDRALSLLPAETGQLLIEHYIQESSHNEIAAKLNLKPGTVAVRLQRGKLTLQKLLRTRLKEESEAFGLIRQDTENWEETNIWCLSCGQFRLRGRFQKNEVFALRCPQCDPEPHRIMAGMDLSQPYYANLLGTVKTYKPAYIRLLTTLAPLYRQALRSHDAACPVCGRLLHVNRAEPIKSHQSTQKSHQFQLDCSACGWASNITLSGLVIGLPETQRFWREFPRLRILPDQEIEAQGSPAFLTRIQSITGTAELHVISIRGTFEPLEVHTNIPL